MHAMCLERSGEYRQNFSVFAGIFHMAPLTEHLQKLFDTFCPDKKFRFWTTTVSHLNYMQVEEAKIPVHLQIVHIEQQEGLTSIWLRSVDHNHLV